MDRFIPPNSRMWENFGNRPCFLLEPFQKFALCFKTSLDSQPLQVSLLKDLPEKKETDAHSQPF